MQGHADCASKYLALLFGKAFREGDLAAFDCAIYLFQPVRFIFIGLMTVMMWVQSFYPEAPFYTLQYLLPAPAWYVFVVLQFLYGPLVILSENKFDFRVLLAFLVYPFYCLTWVPITIQGFLTRKNKAWNHTKHTRVITIKDLRNPPLPVGYFGDSSPFLRKGDSSQILEALWFWEQFCTHQDRGQFSSFGGVLVLGTVLHFEGRFLNLGDGSPFWRWFFWEWFFK